MIRIVIQEGEAERSTHVADRTSIRIGREPSNDVILRDRFVSARHGELRIGADGLAYVDFATTNGSRVRRGDDLLSVDAAVSHRVVLREGDELQLGDRRHPVRLRFELAPARAFSSRGVVAPPALVGPTEFDATHAKTLSLIPAGFDREVLLALHRLTLRLVARLDLGQVLDAFADATLEAFPGANHVGIWLVAEDTGSFVPAVSRSRRGETRERPVSRTVRDRVLAQGKAVAFDEREEGFDAAESLHDTHVRAGLCVPLWDGRRVTGLVQVDCRGASAGRGFADGDLEVLAVFAHQAAMSIANARLHANLQRSVEQAIAGLVGALEAKDTYTAGHSEAVARLCADACRRLDLGPDAARTVRRAALLHDIGKIGIPYDILNKQGALGADEFAVLKSHASVGARILQPFDFLEDLVPIVLHHHERWDGKGYPAGLAGEQIPLGARILSICDAWHSLVHDRAYRAGVGADVALAELRRCAGRQFDPTLVEALGPMLLESAREPDTEDVPALAEAPASA